MINCQSVCNKSDQIVDHLVEHELDILSLTETWLKDDDSLAAANITPAGYNLIHVPRKHRRGGGVGLLYKSCLSVTTTKGQDQLESFEVVECDFTHDNVVVKVVTIYRPPPSRKNNAKFSDFIQEFSSLLNKYALFTGKLLILGDFNVHWENLESNETIRFQSLLNDHNLQQLVNGPTHESGHTLDLVITRIGEEGIGSVDVNESISDHSSVHCQLSLQKPKPSKKVIHYRKIKAIYPAKFTSDISESRLCSSNGSLAADELVHQYNEVMGDLLDEHAQQRSCFVVEHLAVPWYNQDIANAKQKRRCFERKWRRTRLTIDRKRFKDQRNATRVLFQEAKSNYFNNLIIECGKDQKALYGIIHKLLHQKSSSENKLPHHVSDAELATDFSHYFVAKIDNIRNIMQTTASSLVESPESSVESPVGITSPSNDDDTCLTSLSPTCPAEVRGLIQKTPSKTCSLDPIPTILVKQNSDVLALPIAKIVNASLRDGKFPHELKLAYVSPILKKSTLDQDELSSYRPISNLPFLAKVTEKIVACRLTSHLQEKGLHQFLQSAYKKYHSVETALVKISDDILRAIDERKAVI